MLPLSRQLNSLSSLSSSQPTLQEHPITASIMCKDLYRRTLCGACEKDPNVRDVLTFEGMGREECERAKRKGRQCSQKIKEERDASCRVCGEHTMYGLYEVGRYW